MPRRANRDRLLSPQKLPAKLLAIRLALNESQNGILLRLGFENEFGRDYVSKWERGLLEPPLLVLAAYADTANIFLEVLVHDNHELPSDLPAKTKSIGIEIE